MSAGPATAVALTFIWLGMVLAISFLEAPMKFRAPGVTLQIGLGIGRLVFRALNTAEVLIAVGIAIALGLSNPRSRHRHDLCDRLRCSDHPTGRCATTIDAPLRCGAGRRERPALPCPLRLRGFRSGQARRVDGGRNSPAIQLNLRQSDPYTAFHDRQADGRPLGRRELESAVECDTWSSGHLRRGLPGDLPRQLRRATQDRTVPYRGIREQAVHRRDERAGGIRSRRSQRGGRLERDRQGHCASAEYQRRDRRSPASATAAVDGGGEAPLCTGLPIRDHRPTIPVRVRVGRRQA